MNLNDIRINPNIKLKVHQKFISFKNIIKYSSYIFIFIFKKLKYTDIVK